MTSYCITKNTLDFEIETLTNKINLLLKDKVYNNFIDYTEEMYEKQLCSCTRSDKYNIAIDEFGKPFLSKDDDCIYQSHYTTIKDKVLESVCDKVITDNSRDIKDFRKYILKTYSVDINETNINSYINDLKAYDKHLYYKLFTKCSDKLRKEHLSNAEIAYVDYLDGLKDDLILLEEERKRYFS